MPANPEKRHRLRREHARSRISMWLFVIIVSVLLTAGMVLIAISSTRS